MTANWILTKDLSDAARHDGSYLLHGPALVHLDFNPEGVERGYWQDGAWPDNAPSKPNELGPGAWCLPKWLNDDESFDTWFVGDDGITHCAEVPSGPHSYQSFEEKW